MPNKNLDIIIPVFNESENIIRTLDSLKKHVITPFRVLIAYDFDEDDTLPVLRNYEDLDIVLIKNKGQGPHSAILSGFEASMADAVLVLPADDEYNAPMLDIMYEKFKEGADIVTACRFMPGGHMTGAPWLKDHLVRCASWTLRNIAFIPSRDVSNGFRLFSRRVIDTIEIESSVGFTYSIEILAKTHRLGWRISEVPAGWFERKKGQSRFKVLKWLFPYLRWYFYFFGTTYLFCSPESVKIKRAS